MQQKEYIFIVYGKTTVVVNLIFSQRRFIIIRTCAVKVLHKFLLIIELTYNDSAAKFIEANGLFTSASPTSQT